MRLSAPYTNALLWSIGIEARLVYLQVVRHEDLTSRAERQQSRTIEAPAKRGEILDRRGRVLAYSVDADTIYRRLNRASLTGNFLTEGNTSINFDLLRQALVPVALSQTLFFQYQTLQQGSVGAPRTVKIGRAHV